MTYIVSSGALNSTHSLTSVIVGLKQYIYIPSSNSVTAKLDQPTAQSVQDYSLELSNMSCTHDELVVFLKPRDLSTYASRNSSEW